MSLAGFGLVLLVRHQSVGGAAVAGVDVDECRVALISAGVDDAFSPLNMAEGASPSAGLLSLLGPNPAGFDGVSTNQPFGHSFVLPRDSCVTNARLELRARPLREGPSGSANDAMHLGFVSSAGLFDGAIGSAYFGTGNTPPPPALLANAWIPSNYPLPDGWSFDLALGDLAGGANLLPDLDATRSLDVYVQDDTSVDHLRLFVSLCPCATAIPTVAAATATRTPTPTPSRTATRAASATATPTVPVAGYADLHVHQFTHEGLGGAWLHGSATGPIPSALPRCSGNLPFASGRGHGALDKLLVMAIAGPAGGFLIGQLASEASGADTGLHANRRHGYCQENVIPGPGLCRGNVACNLFNQSNCTPTHVCEWKSIGTLCRDRPGDGIGVGSLCNLVSTGNCHNTCYWDWPVCKGNVACNSLGKSKCKARVCDLQSAGSICRDRDGDGKSVGLACNTLGQASCAASCSWDAGWGSITLHAESRTHDWTDRKPDNVERASWPSWDAIAHQQVHTSWLHEAYQDGLRLMVMSALNNEVFCNLLPLWNRAPAYDCKDLANITRQLDAALALDADPSVPWYQIAYTAEQARSIIQSNKLAVVLSVEASDIFNGTDPLATLQAMHDKGVRTLQPLHQFNSKLGGVAWHEGMIKTVQSIKNLPSLHHLCKDQGGTGSYAKCDATKNNLNFLGLTRAGRRFVIRMLNLGMPVDIAHMSELSVKDVDTLVSAACDYPVYVSHGHVRALLDEDSWKADKKHEKTSPDWELDLLQRTGGMFGLRTGADHHEANAYLAALQTAGLTTALPVAGPVPMPGSKIGGNEIHFAYALDYLHRIKNVDVALGSDFNGLIPQMVFQGEPQDTRMAGLAHIGKLPTMFSKLAASGLDLGTYSQLKHRSAESYLQMWERAAAFARGDACCPLLSVENSAPTQAWHGRANRVMITGSGFTPHASMSVHVNAPPIPDTIECGSIEFVSSTQLRCTLPPLSPDTSYEVTVRNGGCNLEASKGDAYFATRVDGGPIIEPEDPPFIEVDVRTVLADEIPANGWLAPNPAKIAAVDWTDPVWEEAGIGIRNVPADRPVEDGYPQHDWEAATTQPDRLPISPALDLLIGKEDAELLSDPLTMLAACDLEEEAKTRLASSSGWPADWQAQINSLCDWQSNVCVPGTFTCPGGAVVERIGQVTDATTASCPFDVASTLATCSGATTPTATPDPTPTPTHPPDCPSDCNGDGSVTVEDLVSVVNIATEELPLSACHSGAAGVNDPITFEDIAQAVHATLDDCGLTPVIP